MSEIKNFCAILATYLIPPISVILIDLLFYIPRSSDFWNFTRLVPFYTGVYFWLSQRPDAFNGITAFILGTVADVISATPLGINILTFLFLYYWGTRLSTYFNVKKFSYAWLLFALTIFITIAFKFLITSTFHRSFVPLNQTLLELLLTITIYPILTCYYIWVERHYIHLEERYEKI